MLKYTNSQGLDFRRTHAFRAKCVHNTQRSGPFLLLGERWPSALAEKQANLMMPVTQASNLFRIIRDLLAFWTAENLGADITEFEWIHAGWILIGASLTPIVHLERAGDHCNGTCQNDCAEDAAVIGRVYVTRQRVQCSKAMIWQAYLY